MTRVILLHGNGDAHGTDQWFPYVKSEIEKMGIICVAPDLPDNQLGRSKYWFPYFEHTLKIGPDDIVVGHSTGAIAILKYAEKHKIGASILVGSYYTDLGYEEERASGYFDSPWDWDAIKANQKWTAIFASTDDPFIPITHPRFIRDQLGSEYFEFTDRGHFGLETDPMLTFTELVIFLKNKLS